MSDPAIGILSTVVVDYEQSWGVPKNTPAGFKLGVSSCSLTPAQTLITNPTLRGDFNSGDPALGPISASGSLVKVADVISSPWFTKLLCGNLSEAGAGPNYTHTSIIAADMPKSATIETSFNIGGSLRYSTASGVRINRMSIPIEPTGFLTTSYDLMAANVIPGGSTAYNVGASASKAYTLLTSNASAPADDDTVKIGSKTYRFKTSLLTANDVLIGSTANAVDALFNLKSAVNDSGDEAVLYGTATTANADFEATTLTPTTLILQALVAGTAANASDSTHPIGTTLSFPGITFALGTHPGTAADSPASDWSGNNPLDHLELAAAEVQLGGSPVGYISKGNIAIDCNLGGNDYRVGASGARGSLVPGKYKVSGSLDLALDSTAVLTLITAGTPVQLEFKWAADADTYFYVNIPRCFIQKTGPTLTGEAAIMVTASFEAAYDSGTASMIQFVTSNQTTTGSYV